MKTLFSASFIFLASNVAAEEPYAPMELTPESNVAACDLQPTDQEKLLAALTFFISRHPNVHPYVIVDGSPSQSETLILDPQRPEAVIAAQPECCWTAYEDPETYKSSELRDRLGENFGGFAYVRLGMWYQSEDASLQKVNSWESYVLDACGRVVFIMSND